MRLSYNELYTNVKKGCIAVGVAIGVAEDAARSACNGVKSGMDCLEQLAVALDEIHGLRSSAYDSEQALRGSFISINAHTSLSALNAAPSACDLTILEPIQKYKELQTGRIKLTRVDVPALIIYEALKVSRNLQKDDCIWWELNNKIEGEGLCLRGTLIILHGSYKAISNCRNCSMTMKKIKQKNSHMSLTAHVGTVDNENIDSKAWGRITEYADMLLVETSESSRMEGAGAGIVDRD